MAYVAATINVGGAVVTQPGVPTNFLDGSGCVYFEKPHIFLHGTREELAAFARAILGKVTSDGA
jgi:hypothetical protein